MISKPESKIYSVSQVNSLIKGVLEENLPRRLTIMGEISDWRHHQSGHCYFSLKDENSVLPCVMWKSKFGKVKFAPEKGLAVLCTGYIDVYLPHGRYQFMAEKLIPAGVGALQLAYEQMAKRLEKEGLFDDAHKKALPPWPERICILTSESGAAVHDIADSIFNRWPCVRLFLYPVPVQGTEAAEKIAAAIRNINSRGKELKLDILIVGRGGGSLEDLWAFNEEVLARAIYDSQIPVISAVGHEVDVTISDLVADKRASTPTKAGVVAVPDIEEVIAKLAYFEESLAAKAKWKLQLCSESIATILASLVFRSPFAAVRTREQRLDELGSRMSESIRKLLAETRAELHSSYEKIVSLEPHRLLGRKMVELANFQNRAQMVISKAVSAGWLQLAAYENRLAALNPKSVLQRGYSITANKKTGLVVRKLADVQVADVLVTELSDENLIESKVIRK